MKPKAFATIAQKENFKTEFATIVADNKALSNNYSVQFFDTASKSNYVFNGTNGKSINVMEHLSEDELEKYRQLKNNWQN